MKRGRLGARIAKARGIDESRCRREWTSPPRFRIGEGGGEGWIAWYEKEGRVKGGEENGSIDCDGESIGGRGPCQNEIGGGVITKLGGDKKDSLSSDK